MRYDRVMRQQRLTSRIVASKTEFVLTVDRRHVRHLVDIVLDLQDGCFLFAEGLQSAGDTEDDIETIWHLGVGSTAAVQIYA